MMSKSPNVKAGKMLLYRILDDQYNKALSTPNMTPETYSNKNNIDSGEEEVVLFILAHALFNSQPFNFKPGDVAYFADIDDIKIVFDENGPSKLIYEQTPCSPLPVFDVDQDKLSAVRDNYIFSDERHIPVLLEEFIDRYKDNLKREDLQNIQRNMNKAIDKYADSFNSISEEMLKSKYVDEHIKSTINESLELLETLKRNIRELGVITDSLTAENN